MSSCASDYNNPWPIIYENKPIDKPLVFKYSTLYPINSATRLSDFFARSNFAQDPYERLEFECSEDDEAMVIKGFAEPFPGSLFPIGNTSVSVLVIKGTAFPTDFDIFFPAAHGYRRFKFRRSGEVSWIAAEEDSDIDFERINTFFKRLR